MMPIQLCRPGLDGSCPSFVAGDTLKGNVDSMRSPRGARASPTLGSVKEASQRRSDAPAPQVGARKASAVSNVI